MESFIDYRVPPEKITPLAEFDGSVIVERTAGEVSARCHDEQANFLALNLMHDVVTDRRTVADARAYYAKEFLDAPGGSPRRTWRSSTSRPPDQARPIPTNASCRTTTSSRRCARASRPGANPWTSPGDPGEWGGSPAVVTDAIVPAAATRARGMSPRGPGAW